MTSHPWLVVVARAWAGGVAFAGNVMVVVAAAGIVVAPAAAQPVPAAGAASPAPQASARRFVDHIDAAIEAAWQRAVAAREARAQQENAQADRAASSNPWAAPPALEATHRGDRWPGRGGDRETEVGIALPLWLPGQRSARSAVSDAAAIVADRARAAARLRIAGEVREAAWALVGMQAEQVQADALVASLKALADDVDRRVRAGDLARADALAARAEVMAAVAQQSDARQRRAGGLARWTVLTGLNAMPALDVAIDATTDTTITEAGDDIHAASTAAAPGNAASPSLDAHPELEHAAATTELARRRVELQRASRRDAPELTVGVRHASPGGIEPSRNSLGVGIRVPFGTDDRNRPLEVAAFNDLELAELAALRLRERLAADADTARAGVQAAVQQRDAERQRARLLRERAELIDKSFRAGEMPLPELLRALAAAAQGRAGLAQRQAALGLAHARLQQALGVMP